MNQARKYCLEYYSKKNNLHFAYLSDCKLSDGISYPYCLRYVLIDCKYVLSLEFKDGTLVLIAAVAYHCVFYFLGISELISKDQKKVYNKIKIKMCTSA